MLRPKVREPRPPSAREIPGQESFQQKRGQKIRRRTGYLEAYELTPIRHARILCERDDQDKTLGMGGEQNG